MAKAILPTNFTDDVLNESMDGKRRYNMIPNADGSQSLEDVTAYDQLGSNFGASNINAMNQAINESFDKNKMISDMDELDAVTQSGYGVDALLVKEVNDSLDSILVYSTNETICGTWINGEKLYRKVYTLTLPNISSTKWTDLFQLPTNIKVKNMRGTLSTSTVTCMLPYIEEVGGNNYSVYIAISNGYLRALGTNGYKGGSVEFIIEYTY